MNLRMILKGSVCVAAATAATIGAVHCTYAMKDTHLRAAQPAAVIQTQTEYAAVSTETDIDLPKPTTTQPTTTQPTTTQPTTTQPTTTQLPTTQTPATQTNPGYPEDGQTERTQEDTPDDLVCQKIRVYRAYEPQDNPRSCILNSRSALEDALARIIQNDNSGAWAQNLTDAAAVYTPQWFESHRLVMIELQASSGSYRYELCGMRLTDNKLRIEMERIAPHILTCDVAHWVFLVPVQDMALHPDTQIDLVFKYKLLE